jgi:hypothetical protein
LIAFRYHHNQRQQAKQQPISILLATHQVWWGQCIYHHNNPCQQTAVNIPTYTSIWWIAELLKGGTIIIAVVNLQGAVVFCFLFESESQHIGQNPWHTLFILYISSIGLSFIFWSLLDKCCFGLFLHMMGLL